MIHQFVDFGYKEIKQKLKSHQSYSVMAVVRLKIVDQISGTLVVRKNS